jgi:hypothetical protein
VVERISDLRSVAKQVTVSVEPILRRAILRADYTVSDVSATVRGFDGYTFGSPETLETARSSFDVRHRATISLGKQLPYGFGATILWRLQSGVPYTPIVGTDINGDGLTNDRAFVFDPARVPDTAFAHQLRSLYDSRSAQARHCLERQLGRPAATNDCEGPWTSVVNAALRSSTVHLFDEREAVVSLDFSNVLAGLDQLIHGSQRQRGWGNSLRPDPVLFNVRGFDAQTRSFFYAANAQFGSTNPRDAGFGSAFRATLSVRVELGRPRMHSDFERFLAMDPLRQNFTPAPVDTLASRLAGDVSDAYLAILQRRDSLLLTATQVRALDSLHARYREKSLALWQRVAEFIHLNRERPDYREINRQVDAATESNWALQRKDIPLILGPLSPAQTELARSLIRFLIESEKTPPPRFREF